MHTSYVVRFGLVRNLGEFTGQHRIQYARGDSVVIRSERGTELGEVLCPSSEQTADLLVNPYLGTIVRLATAEDLATGQQLAELRQRGFETCLEFIKQRFLQMKLVDVEAIFGNERIVFYYLAENRVDFRELVKDLARVFRTRIEMRQIGVRDEAKLLADYGDCGKPVCCNTHLTRMPPVSMRMAKLQKSTLDPTKISGRCGRLKCCLRYEFNIYQELEAELPQVGSRVTTRRGSGHVEALEILAQKVLVELDDRRRILIDPSDVLSVTPGRRSAATSPPREEPFRTVD
jgi:cell fate regulator YaaT (PSP1 superfamily)